MAARSMFAFAALRNTEVLPVSPIQFIFHPSPVGEATRNLPLSTSSITALTASV
jgi:hypothetical protein